MKINELNDDNISEITEYIFREYETPLSEGKLSKEQKELLRIAAKTVTFLTAEPVRNL
ncbi:MAG: hypothetical protein LKF58_02710 [Bacilli bacterium]|jgi:hypothetical protein|nr:hypothetical protein [Bacilli bacterium]